MGGDGGVIATNRRYMRGAGTADHTGDATASSAVARNPLQEMTTCALTGRPLGKKDSIVACAFGRLYLKEAIVQALLRKKHATATMNAATNATGEPLEELPSHIRKLSHVMEVRGHFDDASASTSPFPLTCPLTGKALNGTIPAILLHPANPASPNVLSIGALEQMDANDLQQEYGPIQRKIRLAPPPEIFKEMQREWEQEQQQQLLNKKSNKKRKHRTDGEGNRNVTDADTKGNGNGNASKAQRKAGQDSYSNTGNGSNGRGKVPPQGEESVLSSLFTKPSNKSDKQKKDDLFAR